MQDSEHIRADTSAGRRAGVCLHMTSLPGNFGIGELGDAALHFIDCLARMNLRVWQFLPTGPTGYGDSPYQPLSTFAGNEMLLDVATLVREGLLTSSESAVLHGLSADSVDYGALIPRKTALLHLAAGRFHSTADAATKSAFDEFIERNDALWLRDYALYRILKSQHGEVAWQEWPGEFVHRDSRALDGIVAARAAEIDHIRILQFLFHRQWQALHEYAAERNVLLFGDMPICIAMDSSDTWADRDIVSLDADGRPDRVAGVPPDYFSADGQLWGNPLYDWEKHAADGYRWWIERLRQSVRQSDLVRIDHFRAFDSYWAVPADAETARHGEWLPGPGDAIFDAMRDALGHLPIVAEDLGVITPEVEALRRRHRIPGMKVLQFEVGNDNFNIADFEENCVCYTGTHDNDTALGWFHGSPDDRRSEGEILHTRERALAVTDGHPDTIHSDLIKLAFGSPANIAIAPMQDFLGLGSCARLNTPGTSDNNWRWRMRNEDLAPALLDAVAEWAAAGNRDG